jgi:hypothetical protein
MLTFAADALPRGYKEDHGKELKRRRHWEPLTREAYAALYHAARLDLKGTQLNYFAPEDALLVTLHAPREEDPVEGYWDGDAPRAFTFAEYHARYFEAATAKKAAEDKAREEAEAAAAIAKAEMEEVRLLPIRPRSRGARRSLRTFPVVTLHPRFPFNVRLTAKTFD